MDDDSDFAILDPREMFPRNDVYDKITLLQAGGYIDLEVIPNFSLHGATNAEYAEEDIIKQHMDIREPLSKLRNLLEDRLGIELTDFHFWLNGSYVLECHKNLVDQCIGGEDLVLGLVQIHIQIKSPERRMNIVAVLKPVDDYIQWALDAQYIKEQKMDKISRVLSEFEGKYKKTPDDLLDLFCLGLEKQDANLLNSLIYPGSPVISTVSSKNKMTALHYASIFPDNSRRVIQKLINLGANINATTYKDMSPLFLSLKNEFSRMGNQLKGESYLYDSFRVAQVLVKNGADVNTVNCRFSPIQYALYEGCLKAVEIFIKEEDRLPKSKFSISIWDRIRHVAEWLVKEKMNYNMQGGIEEGYSLLLHFLITQGDDEAFKYALENINDFDVNASLINEYSFFNYAVAVGTPFMIRSLIDKGADPHNVDCMGIFPLVKAIVSNRPENVQCLLDCGVSVNISQVQNCSPLHYAVYLGRSEIVEMLVIKGADVNATSLEGKQSVLSYCLSDYTINDDASIKLLFYPYEVCLNRVFNLQIIDFLLRNGADIEATDLEGFRALDYACTIDIDIVKMLLSRGAQVREITITCAARGAQVDILKLILEEYINKWNSICPYNDALRALNHAIELGEFYPSNIPTLAAFVAKIKASNWYVHPNNRELLLVSYYLENEGKESYKKCEEEIACMKMKMISSAFKLSFYDILMKEIDYLGRVLMVNDIAEVLAKGHYKNDFLIYGEDLEERIRIAKYRRCLLDVGVNLCNKYVEKRFPAEIWFLILKYLNLKDLENFAYAGVGNVHLNNVLNN